MLGLPCLILEVVRNGGLLLSLTVHESYASSPTGDDADILFEREEPVAPSTFWMWHLKLLGDCLY
jgi:hypothetical protein